MDKLFANTFMVFLFLVFRPLPSIGAQEADATTKTRTRTSSGNSGQVAEATKKGRQYPSPSTAVSRPTRFAPVMDETRYSTLLESKSVQREIGLTEKQAKALDALHNSQFARNLPLLENYRNATGHPEERAVLKTQLDLLFQEFARETKGVLNKSQSRRLVQISVQHAGLRAFLMPEVAEALNLAPERQEAIRQIIETMDAGNHEREVAFQTWLIQEVGTLPDKNYDVFRKSKKYLTRRDQYNQAIADDDARARQLIYRLLTRRQVEKYKAFLDQPFDPEKHRRPEDEQTSPR